MKNLIILLLLALSCSSAFALGPEKDGPFPRFAQGIWTSQTTPFKITVQVFDTAGSKIQILVMITGKNGVLAASGRTFIEPSASVVHMAMLDVANHEFPITLRLLALDGQTGFETHLDAVIRGVEFMYDRQL